MDRRNALGKAHSTAHRYLQERGVWEGVAQILDRHFTMSVATQPRSNYTKFLEQPNEQVCLSDVNLNVDEVVPGQIESNTEVYSAALNCLPDIIVIPKKATETANALAETLSTPAAAHISSVPDPLITSVPNPLAAFQSTSFPDMSPMKATSSCKKSTPRVSTCSLDVPMEILSQQDLVEEEEEEEEEYAAVVPVSPLSNGGFQSTPASSVPAWSLNKVTFFDEENAPNDEWALDPLVLLA